jgi:PAS domain-containing protein
MGTDRPSKEAAPEAPAHGERVRFCSRCGALPEDAEAELPRFQRVCGDCGMGVYLSAPAGARRALAVAFLVVTEDLRVSAVSEAAERIFGAEAGIAGTPLTALLAGLEGDEPLRRAVRRAALGAQEIVELPVTAAPAAARRSLAVIAPCGPPRAALVGIEPAAG